MLLGDYERAQDFIRLDGDSEWATLGTRIVYQPMGRLKEAAEQHARLSPEVYSRLALASFYGPLARCLAGAPPEAQGRLTEDDVRAFLDVRDDPEPLSHWAADLASCGHAAPALQLLRESIRRGHCSHPVIEADPMLASIRTDRGSPRIVEDARACRANFDEHARARSRAHRTAPRRRLAARGRGLAWRTCVWVGAVTRPVTRCEGARQDQPVKRRGPA